MRIVLCIFAILISGQLFAQEPTDASINTDIQRIITGTSKYNSKDYSGAKTEYEAVVKQFEGYYASCQKLKSGLNSELPAPVINDQKNIDGDLKISVQFYKQAKADLQTGNQISGSQNLSNAEAGFKLCLSEMLYTLSMSKFSLKEYPAAMTDLDRSLQFNELNTDTYIQRGWCRQHIKDTDLNESYNDFTKAIEIDPKNTQARYYRAQLLFNLQMDRDAVKELDKALSVNPNYADALCLRGMVKLVLCMEDTMMIYPGCEDIKRAADLGLELGKYKYENHCSTAKKRYENQQQAWRQGEAERAKKRREEEQMKNGRK